MKIPVWIGTPLVLALATTDAVLTLQTHAVGALTRAVMRRMLIPIPIEAPRVRPRFQRANAVPAQPTPCPIGRAHQPASRKRGNR